MSRERLVSKMSRQGHPPPKDFIPGIGGPYYIGGYGNDDEVSRKRQHKNFGPRPQQAPYKKGQARRSRQLRRHTRPTPGSLYNRNRPHLD